MGLCDGDFGLRQKACEVFAMESVSQDSIHVFLVSHSIGSKVGVFGIFEEIFGGGEGVAEMVCQGGEGVTTILTGCHDMHSKVSAFLLVAILNGFQAASSRFLGEVEAVGAGAGVVEFVAGEEFAHASVYLF